MSDEKDGEDKVRYVPLPRSLRKHIQRRKRELRDRHGEDSDEYRAFLAWIDEKRREKREQMRT